MFCPELAAEARILVFRIGEPYVMDTGENNRRNSYLLSRGEDMSDSTRNLRTMLAVHAESRAIASEAVPDVLLPPTSNLQGDMRWNREKDIIMIQGLLSYRRHRKYRHLINGHNPKTEGGVVNLAINTPFTPSSEQEEQLELNYKTGLRRLYLFVRAKWLGTWKLRWVAEPRCQSMLLHQDGTPIMYCWPGAGMNVPDSVYEAHVRPSLRDMLKRIGIELVLGVRFSGDRGLKVHRWVEEMYGVSDERFDEAIKANPTVAIWNVREHEI